MFSALQGDLLEIFVMWVVGKARRETVYYKKTITLKSRAKRLASEYLLLRFGTARPFPPA